MNEYIDDHTSRACPCGIAGKIVAELVQVTPLESGHIQDNIAIQITAKQDGAMKNQTVTAPNNIN